MGACKDCSKTYLKLLNGLLLILSIVVLGYSGYLVSELGDFADAYNEGAIVVPVVFGAFMFLVSALGLCAVYRFSKILMILYLVFAFMITLAVLASGAVLLSLSDEVGELKNDDVNFAADSVQAQLVDFELAVFQECCVNNADFGVDGNDVLACSDENAIQGACISNQERFDDIASGVPGSLCEFLEDVDIDGNPIVGNSDANGCGGGSADQFVRAISEFLEDNLRPLGIANTVIAVLMIMDLITTCILLWSSKDDFDKKQPLYNENKQGNQQADPSATNGGNVVY